MEGGGALAERQRAAISCSECQRRHPDSRGCGANVYLEVTHLPLSGLLSSSAQSHNELNDKQLEE